MSFMENNIEIFLRDLSRDKQSEILERLGNNGNFDVFPIAVIPVGKDEPGCFSEEPEE